MEKVFFDWLNNNTGVLAVIIFILTIFLSWVTWILSFFRHKPKLKISTYSKVIPNFFVNEWLKMTKSRENDFKVHRTIFLMWLSVNNIGYSDTTISWYKLEIKDISWKRHRLIPMSLPEPLSYSLWENGDYLKLLPSLTTNYPHLWINNSWKINVWSNILWFLYFNIEYYWSYSPLIEWDKIYASLLIEDIYWREYKFKTKFVLKDKEYLSRFIKPNKLINNQSYEESLIKNNF